MKRETERLETRSKDQITKSGNLPYPEPNDMPEREVRKKSIEFQEREKEFDKNK